MNADTVVVVDGNDGTGKTTLVKALKQRGFEAVDRGLPTKLTLLPDDFPFEKPPAEVYIILDASVEVSRSRLQKAGKDLAEEWHTPESLTHYRERFRAVAKRLGAHVVDATGSPAEVLALTLGGVR